MVSELGREEQQLACLVAAISPLATAQGFIFKEMKKLVATMNAELDEIETNQGCDFQSFVLVKITTFVIAK